LRVPIRSTGGWLELWYELTPRLHWHTGYGIDDPRDNDSLFGRVSNQFLFTNLQFDLTTNLTTGLEVTLWRTQYQERRVDQIDDSLLTAADPSESVTVDWMVKYAF